MFRKTLKILSALGLLFLLAWFTYRATSIPSDPYLYLNTALQVALLLLGVTVTLHEDWALRHRYWVLAAFALLAISGMVVTSKQARKAADDIAASQLKGAESEANLSSALRDLGEATKETARIQNLNTELQKQLLSSNDQIAELARTAIDATVGGDSFSYLTFVSFNPQGGMPVVVNAGRYPLYNLTARIVDLSVFAKLVKAGEVPSIDSPADTVLYIGELATKSTAIKTEFVRFRSTDSKRQDFNVFFSARNGFWSQLVRLRRVDGKWVMATQVHDTPSDGSSRKVLFEQVNKDFPRLPNGDVDWSEQK